MPLPPALAARLEKRGLISADQIQKRDKVEEVIAEDDGDRKRRALQAVKAAELAEKVNIMGHPGCPNKYNVHHECGVFCSIYWGKGILEPDPNYMRKKKRMMMKYPLPEHWKEEYDPGCGRFFYWDQQTNTVSWLPPLHPKAQVSEAASVLREKNRLLITSEDDSGQQAADTPGLEDQDEEASDSEDSDESLSDEEEQEEGTTMHITELHSRNRRDRGPHRSGRVKRDDLDPMDPAAYSDIPRGTWSTGLGQSDEAKTGVDSTASGPLFQQRPYPSPGAVLRANAGKNN